MMKLGEINIDESVAHECFACDLSLCKGACCTLPGGRGAPLLDEEVEPLQQVLPAATDYLDPVHRSLIMEKGIVEGVPGSFATVCLDDEACVFVYYDDGIAKCSIERAWFDKKVRFRKPISCHLFPLRIAKLAGDRIRYESIDECRPAREHGSRQGIFLRDFMKEALVRKYGEKWYIQFIALCKARLEMPQNINE